MKKETELKIIKEWVTKNQNERSVKEFIKLYSKETVINMLYNCWLNTDSELNNTNLNNIWYVNFVEE